ncbi:uncharacterized protein [Cicer arietinum]|uniref:Calumenin-B-like isoform X1 n=1 Tax=Cicer arietinum TaxID=3827 RepID=A0A1S2YV63_CICAR|nr:calumenin-B-like isoform X1 [Cicer arietinum]
MDRESIIVYAIGAIVIFFLLIHSPNNNNRHHHHRLLLHRDENQESNTNHSHTSEEWDENLNVTDTIVRIFPEIDADPTDQFVDLHELTEWNFEHVQREVLNRSQREMNIHDKNHDGYLSFSEYGPPTPDGSFGYDLRLSEEEHFNASDADGDGFLNLAEFNDFLHPADNNSSKIKEWLSKVDVRESDTDRDGKVSFKEFFYGLFDSVRYYDAESYNDLHQSDDSTDASARALFSQLDKDHDGSLSDNELLPIIGKLHPSGHYYAKKQAEYLISLAEVDKDGRLNLTEMIENAYIFYDVIFYDDEVEYDDSPDEFF